MNNSSSLDKRVYWLDFARVFAIISITLNHTVNRTFDMDDTISEFNELPLGLFVFKAFIQIISRIGVPIFLMITGSLLLELGAFVGSIVLIVVIRRFK
jgi:surface polysaccharide O-acyltransferase-like enzyme